MPQRIRAGCDTLKLRYSNGLLPLPQRIRAGCDFNTRHCNFRNAVLCHSAFVRVATAARAKIAQIFDLCHSAFVRVATKSAILLKVTSFLCHSAFVRVATKSSRNNFLSNLLCHSAFVRVATAEKQCSALRICCEKVDSFSSVGESGLALTIFPFSFAAKATYVAINDSFGRAIDRFFWCEPHRN